MTVVLIAVVSVFYLVTWALCRAAGMEAPYPGQRDEEEAA